MTLPPPWHYWVFCNFCLLSSSFVSHLMPSYCHHSGTWSHLLIISTLMVVFRSNHSHLAVLLLPCHHSLVFTLKSWPDLRVWSLSTLCFGAGWGFWASLRLTWLFTRLFKFAICSLIDCFCFTRFCQPPSRVRFFMAYPRQCALNFLLIKHWFAIQCLLVNAILRQFFS